MKKLEIISVGKLKPYKNNSRTHSDEQIEQIIASIKEFGFTNPVLIDKNNTIIAGHGRVVAATKMGLQEVPCLRLDGLTKEQIKAYVIADNKLAENAGWDKELLRLEISELKLSGYNMDLLGFDRSEVTDMIKYIDHNPGEKDPDEVPDLPSDPIAKPGNLWQLGNHRLFCGDSTRKESALALLGSGKADLVFTDPPYNVDYKGGSKAKLSIKNDKLSPEQFYRLLFDAFKVAASVVEPGSPIYVCYAAMETINFSNALINAGWLVKSSLVWVKNHFQMGRQDYHWRHEPFLYGWKAGGAHKWHGNRKQSTVMEEMPGLVITEVDDGIKLDFSDGIRSVQLQVPSYDVLSAVDAFDTTIWKIDKPTRNAEHPTMKPVELPRRAIENSTKNGGIVFDQFLGSGTTMIACEMIGRVCYGIELDPVYCDVIVKRWEDFTGKKAELIK